MFYYHLLVYYLSHRKNSGSRNHVRNGHWLRTFYKHEVSEWDLPKFVDAFREHRVSEIAHLRR